LQALKTVKPEREPVKEKPVKRRNSYLLQLTFWLNL
jgi:hypothetical protein